MKLFKICKDGGPESTVTSYILIEWKRVFSIMLLRFEDGSRDAYHDHAFNAISWLLRGQLQETVQTELNVPHGPGYYWRTLRTYRPSLKPILTWRSTFHKVVSVGRSWALSFRGPWSRTWHEYHPTDNSFHTLTHGRKELP